MANGTARHEPARADTVLKHVHLNGLRVREEHVAHVAPDLALTLRITRDKGQNFRSTHLLTSTYCLENGSTVLCHIVRIDRHCHLVWGDPIWVHFVQPVSNHRADLKRVFDEVRLQLGGGVEDGRADFALVHVSLLHHVTRHVHLDLVLRAEGLLALDALKWNFPIDGGASLKHTCTPWSRKTLLMHFWKNIESCQKLENLNLL